MSASEPMQNERDGKKPASWRQVVKLSPSLFRGVFAIAAVVIFTLALLPGAPGVPSLIGWDKAAHIAAFITLAVLARVGWPSLAPWTLCLALLAYGAAIEGAQSLTGWGRTASLADLISDGIGIALGLLAAQALAPGLTRIFPPRPPQ